MRFRSVILMWLLCGAVLGVSARAEEPPAPPATAAPEQPLPDGDTLHRQIIARQGPEYTKYSGIATERRVEDRVVDAASKKVKEIRTARTTRKDYFYRKADITAVEYKVDGQSKDPSDYSPIESDPLLPVFDQDGPKNYRLKVIERSVLSRRPVFVVEVIPRERTSRHFKGTMMIDSETFDLLFLDGTLAKLPFPVDSVSFKFYLKRVGDLNVLDHGNSIAQVSIPLVLSPTLFISNIEVLSAKPMPK